MDGNETQTSTTETTETPSSTPAHTAKWVAGTNSRFAGKTPEEILGIAEGLAMVAENQNATLQRFNQPVAEIPKNRFDFDLADDALVEGKHVRQILQQFASQGAPVDIVARQQNLALTVQMLKNKYPDEFKRWTPEIQSECAKLPQDYWNLDTLSTCVDIVRSRHVDELAAEKAQRLVNESHPTIRSGSGGSGSVPQTQQSIFENGPPELLSRLRQAGIQNEGDLKEACKGTGITPEQYLEQFQRYGKSGVVHG